MSLVFSIPALIVCGVIVLPSTYWFFRGTDLGSAWAGAGGYFSPAPARWCSWPRLEQRKPTATSSRYDSRHHVHRQLVGLTGLHIIRSSGYQWVRYNAMLAADSSDRGEQISGDWDAHSGTAK